MAFLSLLYPRHQKPNAPPDQAWDLRSDQPGGRALAGAKPSHRPPPGGALHLALRDPPPADDFNAWRRIVDGASS